MTKMMTIANYDERGLSYERGVRTFENPQNDCPRNI